MKKLFGAGSYLAAMLAAAITLLPAVSVAQGTGAKLHGKVMNPAGMVQKGGEVKLTLDKKAPPKERVYKYTFPVDVNGTFSGVDILPGEYTALYFANDKSLDFQDVSLRVGQDVTMDFDMSRAEYLKTMSPEEKAGLEEYKKKNAAVTIENAKVANINGVLKQAREDEKNGKPEAAIAALKPLTEAKPDEAVLWASLGEAQLSQGDAMMKAARAAKTSPSDPAIVQIFTDAAAAYQKAIDLNSTSKKPSNEALAAYQLNLGQAYAKSGKLTEASTAYEASAKASPASAGSAFFNEAAVYFNAGKNDAAAAAADRAIQADPKRADAYYIKAQTLIPKATADPKTGKFILPPGCLEAYQMYLELSPDGAHAAEIKELLNGLGQPMKNSYKAGKK